MSTGRVGAAGTHQAVTTNPNHRPLPATGRPRAADQPDPALWVRPCAGSASASGPEGYAEGRLEAGQGVEVAPGLPTEQGRDRAAVESADTGDFAQGPVADRGGERLGDGLGDESLFVVADVPVGPLAGDEVAARRPGDTAAARHGQDANDARPAPGGLPGGRVRPSPYGGGIHHHPVEVTPMPIDRATVEPRVLRQRPGIERRVADGAGALAGVLLAGEATGTPVDALAAYAEHTAGSAPGTRPGAARSRTVTTAAAYVRRYRPPSGYEFAGVVDLDGAPVAAVDALAGGIAVLVAWRRADSTVCDLVSASAHRRAVDAEVASGRVRRALDAAVVLGSRVTVRLVAPAAGLVVVLTTGAGR